MTSDTSCNLSIVLYFINIWSVVDILNEAGHSDWYLEFVKIGVQANYEAMCDPL